MLRIVRVLFLNRVYPPQEGATGLLLADLASALAHNGWEVTVVAARTPDALRFEILKGVRIERVGATTFTRASHWRRALGYLILYPALFWRAMGLPRADIVLTMTDPPLLLLLGPLLKGIKKSRLVHWAQDIYPEVAEELGIIPKNGWLARFFRLCSTWALRQQDAVIVVGRCMKKRLLHRGLPESVIHVVPNWASGVRSIGHPDNPFRCEHRLEGKFIVMYSGNFGLAHSFDSILEAAAQLQAHHPDMLFLFIGNGPRLVEITQQVKALRLDNVRLLPPQPVEKLAQSLSAADLHLVSMQPNLCGLVVPSKIYGILAAGRPCLFLGPRESEAAQFIEQHQCGSVLEASDGATLARYLVEWMSDPDRLRTASGKALLAARHFTVVDAATVFQSILQRAADPAFAVPSKFPAEQGRKVGSMRSGAENQPELE